MEQLRNLYFLRVLNENYYNSKRITEPCSIYIYVSGIKPYPHPNSKKARYKEQSISWTKGKCEMNTNPRSSITRPVPRSPSLTFRISKRSARTIVSKLNPHSLPFLIFSEAYTFPRRVKSRVWPGDWRRALLFLTPDWWLVKKKKKKRVESFSLGRVLCAQSKDTIHSCK